MLELESLMRKRPRPWPSKACKLTSSTFRRKTPSGAQMRGSSPGISNMNPTSAEGQAECIRQALNALRDGASTPHSGIIDKLFSIAECNQSILRMARA